MFRLVEIFHLNVLYLGQLIDKEIVIFKNVTNLLHDEL